MQNDDNQCNNPNLDLVSINAYTHYGKIVSICTQDIEQAQNSGVNKDHYSGIDEGRMTCNPSLGVLGV